MGGILDRTQKFRLGISELIFQMCLLWPIPQKQKRASAYSSLSSLIQAVPMHSVMGY